MPKHSSISSAQGGLRDAYAHWAEMYDRDPNPILMLARRVMEPLLNDVRDKVVVDIGCGTGHDLELAVSRGAKAVGLDFTPEMLHRAARKKAISTRLVQADATKLPLQEASADLVVCSFVLSYVAEMAQVAEQLARIALPGADLYVVDMHPEAQRQGWREALDPALGQFDVQSHELTDIKQAFDLAGFELQSLVEPRLRHPERLYFETVQRLDLFEQARHVPAICLFHFRRRLLTTDRSRPYLVPQKRQRTWHFAGARYALGPHTAVQADMVVDSSYLRAVHDRTSKARAPRGQEHPVVDLTGLLLLPGLVNAHDDIQAGFPGSVHADVKPWLGALRNLSAGVASLLYPERLDTSEMPQFPVRLARNFAYSAKESVEEVTKDFAKAPPEFPLLVDLSWCEAEKVGKFVNELEKSHLLTKRTVLLGVKRLDERSQLLTERETALVWIPSSSEIDRPFLETSRVVAIGTGASGRFTMTDGIRAAAKWGVAPETIYSMVTSRAATILRLRNGEGRITAETPADFLVLEDAGITPAESLCTQTPIAVIVGGRPQLVNQSIVERIPEALREPLRPFTIGKEKWWAEEHIVAATKGATRALTIGGEAVKA